MEYTQINLEEVLHPRLREESQSLFEGGHYKHAALEAMQQVEAALREKGVAQPKAFGARLVQQTFGKKGSFILTIPFDDSLRDHAKRLFESAFSYYRNYLAHDGAGTDKTVCFRVMVLASELLDMLAASKRSLSKLGGVDGLVRHGFFDSPEAVIRCLGFLDGNWFLDDIVDGYFEDMARAAVTEEQIELSFDFGLVEAELSPANEADGGLITTFALTELGRRVLAEAEGNTGHQ